MSIIALLMIIVVFFCGCTGIVDPPDMEISGTVEKTITFLDQVYVYEGDVSEIYTVNIEEGQALIEITVIVTWIDEPDIQRVRNYRNSPEEIGL